MPLQRPNSSMMTTIQEARPILFYIKIFAVPIVIIAVIYGYRTLRKYIFLDNFGVVEPNRIFRSGQLLPFQLEKVISKYHIKTIIQTNIPELSEKDKVKVEAIYKKHNVQLISLVMPGDGRGEFGQYDKAIEILGKPNNLPSLVCCARGTHRTGSIVAGYRVIVQGWPVDKALKEMEDYRFRPAPHRYKGKKHPLIPHLRNYFSSRMETH